MPQRKKINALNEPRINSLDPSALKQWARELRVTEKQLTRAIEKAGTVIEAVKNELRRKTSLPTHARDEGG